MATPDELTTFVRDALARGLPREEIARVLRDAGWPADQVQTAMGRFADVAFAVPVPTPQPYLTAREAFLYLVLFSTLYTTAFNFGGVLYQLINLAFPDPAIPNETPARIRETLRWNISFLVVAAPVFLYVARITGQETRQDPAKRASKVRRWLTYVTLFLAGSVLVGDVATLVYNLLGGGLTVRFVLKVLVVGGIAGTVFWYYLRDLQDDGKR